MTFYKEQRAKIEKNILEVAIQIFKDKGYEKTTVSEITKYVGVAKGTFYNFYKSKSEILFSWAAQKFQTVNFNEVFNKDRLLEDNLYKLSEILVRSIKDEEQLFQSLLKEIIKVHSEDKYSTHFDFLSLYKQIIFNSKDTEIITSSLLDIKIEVLNNSLYMGIVNWFDSGKSTEGLHNHLINIIKVCLFGLLNS